MNTRIKAAHEAIDIIEQSQGKMATEIDRVIEAQDKGDDVIIKQYQDIKRLCETSIQEVRERKAVRNDLLRDLRDELSQGADNVVSLENPTAEFKDPHLDAVTEAESANG